MENLGPNSYHPVYTHLSSIKSFGNVKMTYASRNLLQAREKMEHQSYENYSSLKK